MQVFMAVGAQGNQIFFGIVAPVAAKCLVVNLKVRLGSAPLASPAIASKDLLSKLLV
jgi:hypothetical protein